MLHSPRTGSGSSAAANHAFQPTNENDAGERRLPMGYALVIDRQRELQTATDGCLEAVGGPNAGAIDRILRNQQVRLCDNVALLENRRAALTGTALPPTARPRLTPTTPARRVAAVPQNLSALPRLVAQHVAALLTIDALIAQGTADPNRDLILSQVARNHEEMAWILTALLKEDLSARDLLPIPIIVSSHVESSA